MDKKYYGILAFDALWIVIAYLWLQENSEGAKNVFIFIAWFSGVFSILGGFTLDKTKIKGVRPKYFYIWHALTDLSIVVICAWNGYFVLAFVYAVGHIFMEAAREREPKEKEVK